MGLGKLILRATMGGYFFGHGMQKLAGWFGGGGPEGTGEMFDQIGLRPGGGKGVVPGGAQAGGGRLPPPAPFPPPAGGMPSGRLRKPDRPGPRQKGLWGTA